MDLNVEINSVKILLIDDSESDANLLREIMKESKVHNELFVTRDGIEGLNFLNRHPPYDTAPRPNLILLDLNMPRMNGMEFLQEVRKVKDFSDIPVVVLTTSDAEADIVRSYELHANCFVSKPLNLREFSKIVRSIEDFWFKVVQLPTDSTQAPSDET